MWWFTSDLHLGHEFSVKTREFNTAEEMKEKIYSMFEPVKKDDFVYILGDVAWSVAEARELIDFLIMKKKVAGLYILEGNHDSKHWLHNLRYEHPKLHISQTEVIKESHALGYHYLFLSHYPQIIYDKSHYGAFQLHGHGHAGTSDRPLLDALVMGKRLNVNCELNDYKLWSRDDVEKYMESMPANIDQILCKGTEKQQQKVIRTLNKINKMLDILFKGIKYE